MDITSKRIALVHDYLVRLGGAERVLKVMHEMFPNAPIYTVVYNEQSVRSLFLNCKSCPGEKLHGVRGSFLQRLPSFLRARYKYFSLLIPTAVEHLDLTEFDIVISSCSAFCKGIITRPDAAHICYCHTPTRFLWDWTHAYSHGFDGQGARGFISKIILHYLRFWDQQAARRVDVFVANSKHVSARIKKYYRKDAVVIYPPVSKLSPSREFPGEGRVTPQDYFLIVSQLRPYKQIDIAIEAFKKLGFPLVIIGEGSEQKRLEGLAKGFDNIRFLGFKPDDAVAHYMQNCKAFIFPGEEDFGMATVEAMLAGKPVLALRKGGALESIIEGVTGEFFDDAHPVVLADGVRRLVENFSRYSPLVIRKRAEKFSRERFEKELLEFVTKHCIIK